VFKTARQEFATAEESAEDEKKREEDRGCFESADQLDRNEDEPFPEWKGLDAHFRGGRHPRVKEGREILCPYGPIDDLETRELLRKMGRHPRGCQLRQDQLPAGYDILQTTHFNSPDQFGGPERPLARSAPDIDSFGIQHENPTASPRKRIAQGIKAHLVIGRYEYRSILARIPKSIETRLDSVMHATDGPSCLEPADSIGNRKFGVNPRNLSDRRRDKARQERLV